MKKSLIILFLLFLSSAGRSQPGISFTKLEKGKPCDTCVVSGGYSQNAVLDFIILGAIEEFVHSGDDLYKRSGSGLDHVSKYFTSSESFSVNFLPVQSADKEPGLPVRNKKVIPYVQLEFQVLHNNSIVQDWAAIASLHPEKDYQVSFTDETMKGYKEWPSFQAGIYHLKIEDSLLVKVRKTNTTAVLQNIYVKRIRTIPEVRSISQFPSGTSTQDILNKEINRDENSWVINGNELEIEAGNSMLLSFDRPVNGEKIIEYSFSNFPNDWQQILQLINNAPVMPLYFLFIEKPAAGTTRDLYIRYKHQPESVRHLKIIVKPKLIQTTAFKITAGIALAVLLFMVGYYYNRRKNKKELQKLVLKKEELENKIQLLSGQFNPHFLFNTLNSIQNLVHKKETDRAGEYISRVATFLRTVMIISKKEYISLQEEMDIAESYLQLEQNRKFFRYKIENDSRMDLGEIDFPPLLLQPVLENSIHHGFTKDVIDPELVLRIHREGKNIIIAVSDNGPGYDPALVKKGHGLNLVERRLQVINETDSGRIEMQVRSDAEGKTVTTFILKEWI